MDCHCVKPGRRRARTVRLGTALAAWQQRRLREDAIITVDDGRYAFRHVNGSSRNPNALPAAGPSRSRSEAGFPIQNVRITIPHPTAVLQLLILNKLSNM